MADHDCDRCHMQPGSDSARARGCICAVLDNGHGHAEPPFWITAGCPVHAPGMTTHTIDPREDDHR